MRLKNAINFISLNVFVEVYHYWVERVEGRQKSEMRFEGKDGSGGKVWGASQEGVHTMHTMHRAQFLDKELKGRVKDGVYVEAGADEVFHG